MTTSAPTPPAFPVAQAMLALGGLSAVLGAGAWFGMHALGRPEQAHDGVLALAVVAGAGVLGLCLVRPLEKKMAGGAAWGFLAGMVIRLPVCAAFIFLAPSMRWGQGPSLTLWVAAWYFGLTMVEAVLVGRHVKKTAAAHAVALRASEQLAQQPSEASA